MPIKEEEKLFVALNMLEQPEPAYVQELVAEGYWNENHENTPKAEEFIERFLDSKMEPVFEAIQKQGTYSKDRGYVLLQAGLTNPLAAELVLEELVKRRKLKKKYQREYIVRCGQNK